MTSRDFCFWLQGMFEVGDLKKLDERQTALIKQHLGLVFQHEVGADAAHDPEPPAAVATEPAKLKLDPEMIEALKKAQDIAEHLRDPRLPPAYVRPRGRGGMIC